MSGRGWWWWYLYGEGVLRAFMMTPTGPENRALIPARSPGQCTDSKHVQVDPAGNASHLVGRADRRAMTRNG
jgi:hypothetical protein